MLVRRHFEVVFVVDPFFPLLYADVEPVTSDLRLADGFRDLFPAQELNTECYNLPFFEVGDTRSMRHDDMVVALQTFRAICKIVPVMCNARFIPFGSLAVFFSHNFVCNPMYMFRFRGTKYRLFRTLRIPQKGLEL